MLKDIVTRSLVTITPETIVSEAAKVMEKKNVGFLLVLDKQGALKGLLTDRDIVLRCIAKNKLPDQCTVQDVMTESIQAVRETDGIYDCIETMRKSGVRRIPVVDSGNRVVGVVSFGDLLGVLSKEFSDLTAGTTHPIDTSKAA